MVFASSGTCPCRCLSWEMVRFIEMISTAFLTRGRMTRERIHFHQTSALPSKRQRPKRHHDFLRPILDRVPEARRVLVQMQIVCAHIESCCPVLRTSFVASKVFISPPF